MNRHLTENADPTAQAEWFLGVARSIAEGAFPELMREEADLLVRLANRAESFVMKRAGEGAVSEPLIESLAAVSILRSSGAIPGRKTSDFIIGQAVQNLRDRRTGSVVGESLKTGELAVKWVGENHVEFVQTESVVAIPHVPNTKLEGTEVLFDETSKAKLNGLVLTPRREGQKTLMSERYAKVCKSGDLYFAFIENGMYPITIPLNAAHSSAQKVIRETVAPTDNRREMLNGLNWLDNDRRIEETTQATTQATVQATAEVTGEVHASQQIFEAIMRCPGSPRDAMWMADYLSRHESLVEATEDALEASEEIVREIAIEALREAEAAFVREQGHMPGISRIMEQIATIGSPTTPKVIGIIGQNRAAMGNNVPTPQAPDVNGNRRFRMGGPNRVFVKRTSEIRQDAGHSKANAELVQQIGAMAQKAAVAASRGTNSPDAANANIQVAKNVLGIFQALFSSPGEPWNPIKLSNQRVQATQQGEQNESVFVVEETILTEQEDSLVAGKPIRLKAQRHTGVYGNMRKQDADPQAFSTLKDKLLKVRRSAQQLGGMLNNRQKQVNMAKALLDLMDFVVTNGDQPWGILDIQ